MDNFIPKILELWSLWKALARLGSAPWNLRAGTQGHTRECQCLKKPKMKMTFLAILLVTFLGWWKRDPFQWLSDLQRLGMKRSLWITWLAFFPSKKTKSKQAFVFIWTYILLRWMCRFWSSRISNVTPFFWLRPFDITVWEVLDAQNQECQEIFHLIFF